MLAFPAKADAAAARGTWEVCILFLEIGHAINS